MFKLLIVDDEPYTLQGIISSLSSWDELDIGWVEQAHNGAKGYETACRFQPDILLTDVRMPRMDGIELAFKYKEVNPDCKVIFMSGYSDKEYLKSAIKLNAVQYIEKPIVLDELKEAIRSAVTQCQTKESARQKELAMNQKLTATMPLIENELAIILTKPSTEETSIHEWLKLADLVLPPETVFVTLLIRTKTDPSKASDNGSLQIQIIFNVVANLFSFEETTGFTAIKDDKHIVAHLYTRTGNTNCLVRMVQQFTSKLIGALPERNLVLISVGRTVTGVPNVYTSYNFAVLAMQQTFYHSEDPVTYYSDNHIPSFKFDEESLSSFQQYLLKKDIGRALLLIKDLTSTIKQCNNTMVNYVKNIYFKFLLLIVQTAGDHDINIFESGVGSDYLWDIVSGFNTIEELEDYLVHKVELFSQRFEENNSFSSIVTSIFKYIQTNYGKEELSVKEISAHTFLTTSYICNLFKQETGKTMNQYITEYRINQAKGLLKDRMLKISDISSRVGYGDSDYFAKLFRKATGQNPSEFRDRYKL